MDVQADSFIDAMMDFVGPKENIIQTKLSVVEFALNYRLLTNT
jgi:hypothetical protein